MDVLRTAAEWVAIIVGGLVIRLAVFVAIVAALLAVLLPVIYAFEGGRRLLRRVRGIEDLHGFEWRRWPRYAATHLWLAERGRIVRVGIDSLAARILARPEHVVLPERGQRVRAGEPLATLAARGSAITLPAPIDGIVQGINTRLREQPDLVSREPYGSGWIVEIRAESQELSKLPRAAQARDWFRAEAVKLTAALEHAGGYAAADGGEPVQPPHVSLDRGTRDQLAAEFLKASVTKGA